MKLTLILFILVMFVRTDLFAQESVGFSDPDNIQPLLDYHLPAWGYSNLFFDFSLSGNYHSQEISPDNFQEVSINELSAEFSPVYNRIRESEPRVSSYSLMPQFDYQYRSEESAATDTDKNYRLRLNWAANEKFYVNDSDLFFTGNNSGSILQQKQSNEISNANGTESESRLTRNFISVLNIGIGFGRMRTVNPMIRALRLNERLGAVGGAQLGETDILSAADQFTRYHGYRAVYDRPEKYFWSDLDQLLTANLNDLSTFDMLYLTDVTQEAIGTRREGWMVTARTGLQYSVSYNDTASGNRINRNTYIVPGIIAEWSKNLSLNHQLRFFSQYQHFRELSNNSQSLSTSNTITATTEWLFTITDRILVQSGVNYVRNNRPDSDLPGTNLVILNSDFNYFLENRASLFARVGYTYRSASYTSKNLHLNAGFRYYLRRQIF